MNIIKLLYYALRKSKPDATESASSAEFDKFMEGYSNGSTLSEMCVNDIDDIDLGIDDLIDDIDI